jgi:hypothetical protein
VRDLTRKLLSQVNARSSQGAGAGIRSRVGAPDEQRTEGTLHTIVCAAGASVSFHVELPAASGKAAAATFVAARLDDVQLVSHREDFTGTIGCGPLKEPMPVRVSWRPGPGDERRVVAIEFLPKRSPDAGPGLEFSVPEFR